jgi:Spy/CpxP family protein refolding chaperone
MTSLRHLLSAIALATAALAGAALAQAPSAGPAPTGPGQAQGERHHAHGAQDKERGAKGFERRMAELKSKLQLTPAQEGAWTTFAEAMRPNPAAKRPDHDAMMKLPTPERIDQMRALHQQHAAQMDQRGEATKTFYATLTPEQKKRFDDQTARMMARRGGMGGDHDHHNGSHGHRGHHS